MNNNQDYDEALGVARREAIRVSSIEQNNKTVTDLANTFTEGRLSEIRIKEEEEKSKIRIAERREYNRQTKGLIASATVSLAILVAVSIGGYMSIFGSETDKERGKYLVSSAIAAALIANGARAARNFLSSSS